METKNKTVITIEDTINAPVEKVWEYWTKPEHIVNWNFAIDEWHSPKAENDIKPGGKFNYRMEAKDGSFGFDFHGVYDEVNEHKYIEYTMGDNRKVKIIFQQREMLQLLLKCLKRKKPTLLICSSKAGKIS